MSSAQSIDARFGTAVGTMSSRLRYCFARLCSIALLSSSLQVAAQSPVRLAELPTDRMLTIHLSADRLNMDARDAPLADVLSQLGEQAGIRVRYNKKRLGQTAITLSLEDAPLNKAIALILRGHSYLLNLGDQARTLVVLSTGRGTVNKLVTPKDLGLRDPATRARVLPSSTKRASARDQAAEASSEPALEKVIADAANSLFGEHTDDGEASELGPSMAIEQLASIDHPDATELIIRATSNDSNAVVRALAADALWQHASNLGFDNPEVNQVLESLAGDADPSVRDIAEEALNDMQAFRDSE